jgi:hypothetical protein
MTTGIWIKQNDIVLNKKLPNDCTWVKYNNDKSKNSIYILTFNKYTLKILYTTSIFKGISNGYKIYHRYKDEYYNFKNEQELIDFFDLNNKNMKLINNINDIYNI